MAWVSYVQVSTQVKYDLIQSFVLLSIVGALFLSDLSGLVEVGLTFDSRADKDFHISNFLKISLNRWLGSNFGCSDIGLIDIFGFFHVLFACR